MVQIDPQGWLIKELDFEKADEENLFQLEHAACVLGRLEAARALVKAAKDKPEVATALARPGSGKSRRLPKREMCEFICNGDETFRAALIEAAPGPEARVRVAAIAGLAKLNRDDEAEKLSPRGLGNPKEAYGARKTALRGLVAWKVKDADLLLADALKVSADHHSIAATALDLMLETPGAKSRELAALYSKYGQPESLRSSAIGAFSRLAKDDPSLQDVLVELADDHDRSVRFRAWNAVRELGVKKALPVLEARLARESADFGGYTRRVLKEAIEALEGAERTKERRDRDGRASQDHRRARAPGRRAREEDQRAEKPDLGPQASAGAGSPAAKSTARHARARSTSTTAH